MSILECNLLFRYGIHLCYYYIAVRYKLKLWEVMVNLRVHKSVSRIGFIGSDYYTTSIFGSVSWGFAPDPTGELTALPQTQWSNCGVPLPFLAGERRSAHSLHDDSYLQHTQQKKMCVKCMI